MNLKRLLGEGGEEGSELPTGEYKRRHLLPTIFRGVTSGQALQEFVPRLEPNLRKWVREAVDCSFQKLSTSYNQIEHSGARIWQLQFQSNIPHTLFTGSRVVSEDKNPVKVVLYDSTCQKIINSGPLSSIKVDIVVLDGEFNLDDQDYWMGKNFDSKTMQNREGKRPLVTGELIVSLHDGVGYIGEVSFTDNSSWIRSGKFKLGAKAHTSSDRIRIREGISNAFKVKDHRGESYQKHYPPSEDDEVWRLEKIAKGGPSHKKLTESGIYSVKDFLRLHFKNQFSLRAILPNISNKIWETIIGHATTCTLDDKLYIYRTAHGTGLFFNSIYKVVGATFNGQNYHSLDKLDIYHMRVVENLKQHAYENLQDWVSVGDLSIIGNPIPLLLASAGENNFNNPSLVHNIFPVEQDHLEMQKNADHPTILFSPHHNCEIEQDNSSFEMSVGESSHQMQEFNPVLRNCFEMTDSTSRFFIGNHMWASENNCGASQLLTDDLPVEDNFHVESSAWRGSGLFVGSNNQNIGLISSNSGILIPRNGTPKTRWCKVLAVVKWQILVRRNVSAKKQQCFYNLM